MLAGVARLPTDRESLVAGLDLVQLRVLILTWSWIGVHLFFREPATMGEVHGTGHVFSERFYGIVEFLGSGCFACFEVCMAVFGFLLIHIDCGYRPLLNILEV